jgi:hypothetical protein
MLEKRKKQVKSKVLRDLRPKSRKMEQRLLGKINTLTEKRKHFFCGQKRQAQN